MKVMAAAKVSMRMFSRKSVQVQLSQSRMRWCIRQNPGSQMELCARMHYVYVCESQLQIMCPHELHLVLMHIVYCLVWMHKHDSEETLHGQGLNPRSVNPPIRDNSTESIRSFQEMPALHNEIQFFTISSKLRCQLSI